MRQSYGEQAKWGLVPDEHDDMKPVIFAVNRENNTAVVLQASCWEEAQGWFRVGILMPDGTSANGIGRCRSLEEFERKAKHGGTRILEEPLVDEPSGDEDGAKRG